ncbi:MULTISPECIES: sulfurtransferase TusA [Pseudomonas]|jgi:tRNA 2-thiouridine synthesizing protein A|uniref:Sulfur carrier protein TusA n=1 Tax=Pseudomonas flexibilis TaxID=706570 RepID=A0A0B2D7U1_9PSED|nr:MULTISPECIES: sulfurtransferase TusA [Pseudomonas]HTN30473.1 sulfurtransferase TusA [Pseudomonas sp.]KHL68980.1 sulfurtransferase TusA [Pseudomonas flexibilis]KHO66572.1 sulfurtransferase [Pseudomonas flexibilis]SCY32795.1 tRNA 2-thiouridine synthesizing protein A [Pseudomonas flexibilis]SIQ61522.1 tRNA 2-thiouridine synthesizing protein A [Pseudomonas flexibilis]
MSLQPDAILDASGLNCPEPVMMLHNKVRDLQAGGLLQVIATDPSTRRDIPKFCVFLGHELVEQREDAGQFLYWIRKKAD